ncbi:kinesin-like protein KIF28P [Lingula anatina]|uniref:Kinesin-like protein KIF28P n=1 Tax=Lingula anatina TaxID=7574 RepID=A0A1S3JPC9_LINAN|nr:kinesin-like protein KIF28P [Lingula anatina]|eukprot:XP_013411854.1 kinesin-like protein KIF28P [Lingula anatina]
MSTENIKVAVRVRPFSQREKDSNAQRIIDMDGVTTYIKDPAARPGEEPKKFIFDHSYWSHDGFKEEKDGYFSPATAKYSDQTKVFNDLGRGMLTNAWEGYNCSIFAYGQTGSGKSYSIMGYGANKGIVPRVCEMLFQQIKENPKEGVEYRVKFSMLEIYNEQVRDLLTKKVKGKAKEGLKVREHATKGFYVEHLTDVPVGNYRDIELRMDDGNRNRTLAATKMNDHSSRAHTIVTVNFEQIYKKENTTKQACINLVDLAGSERSKQTGAVGERLDESKNINKSLSELGNIIKGLHDKASGKRAQLNFRNSKLTMLLKNSLGGNCKTVMVAALSPAAENFEQTLSTLRYADRAKSIKNVAKVNESETDKLIRELIAEKEKLLAELKDAKANVTVGYTEEDIKRMKQEQEAEIERYKEEIAGITLSWEKRLEEARKETEEKLREEQREENAKKRFPHFYNLNEDPLLVAKIIHIIKAGSHRIGNNGAKPQPEIPLYGRSIAREHGVVCNTRNGVTIKSLKGKIRVNGVEMNAGQEIQLHHQDRILFGEYTMGATMVPNLFVFHHPKEEEELINQGKKHTEISYDFAVEEIENNIDSGEGGDEDNLALLKDEIIHLLPLVEDANAMAAEFNKSVGFEVTLIPAMFRGKESGPTEVYVKMHNMENDNEFYWGKNKFLDRQCSMQRIYEEFEGTYNVEKDDDPFYEPPDTENLIGLVSVPLVALAHGRTYDEKLTIRNYEANTVGYLAVELTAEAGDVKEEEKGQVKEGNIDPKEMIGKDIAIRINIKKAQNLPVKYNKVWCKYKFFKMKRPTTTNPTECVAGLFDLKYKKRHKYEAQQVTHEFLSYLQDKTLMIEVWGSQSETVMRQARPRTAPGPLNMGATGSLRRASFSIDGTQTDGFAGRSTLKERAANLGGATGEACTVQ